MTNRRFNDPRVQQIYEQGIRDGAARVQPTAGAGAAELQARVDNHIAATRRQLTREIQQERASLSGQMATIKSVADSLKAALEGDPGGQANVPGVTRVENLPGRRIPFSVVIEIPVGANDTGQLQGTHLITQFGPFVAQARWGVFLSQHQVLITDPVTSEESRLVTRSFGRFRPIHSATDLVDSQHASRTDGGAFFNAAVAAAGVAGTVLPNAALALPSNMSSFRTMQWDGRIELMIESSNMPRQNIPLPSAMWVTESNSPVPLAALDFYDRGDVITATIQPMHPNNPAVGNIDGRQIFPSSGVTAEAWPFQAGQYDAHEGIATPLASTFEVAPEPDGAVPVTTDPVQRLPDGVLFLVLEGYRIGQDVAPVP